MHEQAITQIKLTHYKTQARLRYGHCRFIMICLQVLYHWKSDDGLIHDAKMQDGTTSKESDE